MAHASLPVVGRARRPAVAVCGLLVGLCLLAGAQASDASAAVPVARFTCSSSAPGTTDCTPCPIHCDAASGGFFLTGSPVVFDGRDSSDADGPITNFAWTARTSGAPCPTIVLSGEQLGTGSQISHVFTEAGTYHVTVHVGVSPSNADEKCRTVLVNAAPVAEVAISAPSGTPEPGETISLDASASHDDGATTAAKQGIVSYAWTIPGQPTVTTPATTVSFAAPGTYPLQLSLTDKDGTTTVRDVPVRVNAPPVPAFTASPPSGTATAGQEIAFDAAASTDDSAITDYTWDFGDGTSASGGQVSHVFAAAGPHTVTLRVTDGDGVAAATSAVVDVAAPPPPPLLAKFSTAAAGGALRIERNVRFDGRRSTSADGKITKYRWSFGDGKTATGSRVQHRFHGARAYRVTLTITRADGLTAAVTRTLTIRALPSCPTLRRGSAAGGIVRLGSGANAFDGRGGSDVIHGSKGDDCLYGGSGADTLYGEAGADRLVGGLGADTLSGGLGDDVIGTRGDGAADRVTCGPGYDVVFADRRDRVANDCERVRYAAAPRALLP